MKKIKAFAFTKGAGKFFGVSLFLTGLFFYQNANAQFSVTTAPGATGTVSAGSITVHGNIYVGKGTAGTSGNIAIGGSTSLQSATDATNGNIAIGGLSLTSLGATGNSNVAIGAGGMQLVTSGSLNTAIGSQALQSVSGASTIDRNAVFGHAAMSRANTGANNNSAFGVNALAGPNGGSSSGKWNVGVGSAAGFSNTGDSNTFVGGNAGQSHGAGNRNVAIGFGAALQSPSTSYQLSIQNVIYGTNMNTTAGGKIGIGLSAPSEQLHTNAGVRFQGLTTGGTINNLVGIDGNGKLWRITGVNNCANTGAIPRNDASANFICSQIYDNGITTSIGTGIANTYSWTSNTGGQYGLTGTAYPGGTYAIPAGTNYRLYVNGWTASTGYIAYSDERLKKNIKVIQNSIEKITKIKGYTYQWNQDFKKDIQLDDSRQAGFLAQEIQEILPEAVTKNKDGVYGINYNAIMPLLAEGIKEQQETINELKIEIAELKSKLNEPNNLTQQKNTNEYFQIIPNPIEQESKVVYKLGNEISNAMFVVYDLQGKMIKQMNLTRGIKEGQLALTKSNLEKGMYILSLIINSDEVQSKRFLVL
jgi:trimeric autotransporter adhesin